MRRWLWQLLFCLLWASSVLATDVTPTIRPAQLLTNQTAVAPGTAVAISGFNVVAFQLTGISGDTIQFEVSEDNSTWTAFACLPANGGAAVTSATANGGFQCATGGYAWFRLNKTAGTSSVSATGIMQTLGAGLGRGGGGGGGGSITVREVDGTPLVNGVTTIQVTNTSLTDNGGGNVTIATSGAANMTVGSSTVTGGTNGSLLIVGAGPLLQQANITGLVVGNGAAAPTAYPGATCTNQVIRLLSASGAATCATLTSAYVDTSIWTGSVASGLLKATSQGVVGQASPGSDYTVSIGGTTNQIDLSGAGGVRTAALSSTLVIPGAQIDFTETAGDGTCAAGDYWIKANSTATKFRKCQAGTITDLDTNSGGGSLTLVEADASPSVSSVTSITVPNGSLTDNGSGSTTLNFVVTEADTVQSVFNRGKSTTTANSFANALVVGDATNAVAIYNDSTDGPWVGCSIAGVQNNCDYYRKLNSGKKQGIKNSSGTVIWEVSEATGKVSNLTANVEDTNISVTTVSYVNFDMVGCAGTTGTLNLNTMATLAPTATCTPGSTNSTLMQGMADFPDSDGDYSLQTSFRLPPDWSGAIDLQLYWKAAATSGDVVWQVATMCTNDAEIEDVAWNTADAFAADTAKGTTLQLNTVTKTGITTTGCAAGELMHLKIFRNRTNGSDTIAGVVSLKNAMLAVRRTQ